MPSRDPDILLYAGLDWSGVAQELRLLGQQLGPLELNLVGGQSVTRQTQQVAQNLQGVTTAARAAASSINESNISTTRATGESAKWYNQLRQVEGLAGRLAKFRWSQGFEFPAGTERGFQLLGQAEEQLRRQHLLNTQGMAELRLETQRATFASQVRSNEVRRVSQEEMRFAAEQYALMRRQRADEMKLAGDIDAVNRRTRRDEMNRAAEQYAAIRRQRSDEMKLAGDIDAVNRRTKRDEMNRAGEMHTLIRRQRADEMKLAGDIAVVNRRTSSEERSRAAEQYALIRRQRADEMKLAVDINAVNRRANQEQAQAVRVEARRISQLRQIEALERRVLAGGVTLPPDLQAAGAYLRGGGAPFRSSEWEQLRRNMDATRASLSGQVGMWGTFGDRLQRVTAFMGAVTLAYGAMSLAFRGVHILLEVDRGLSMVAATLDRTQDRTKALKEAAELTTIAMTTFGATPEKANEAVVGLSRAVNGNSELMRAMLVPALSLTTLKEVDMAEAIKVLVGLYNVYGETMAGAVTPTERVVAITDRLHVVSQMSTADVKDFLDSLAMAAPFAKSAGISFEQLIAIMGSMRNVMATTNVTGAGLARLFQALRADARKIVTVFDLPVNPENVEPITLLMALMDKVRELGPNLATFEKLQLAIPLIQGQRAFESFMLAASQYPKVLEEAHRSTGKTATVVNEATKAATVSVSSLFNELVLGIDRVITSFMGLDAVPGKFEGIAAAARLVQDGIWGISAAIAAIPQAPQDRVAAAYRWARDLWLQRNPGEAARQHPMRMLTPPVGVEKFGPPTPSEALVASRVDRNAQIERVLADARAEARRQDPTLSFPERIADAEAAAGMSSTQLRNVLGSVGTGKWKDRFGKPIDDQAGLIREIQSLARDAERDRVNLHKLRREFEKSQTELSKQLQLLLSADQEALIAIQGARIGAETGLRSMMLPEIQQQLLGLDEDFGRTLGQVYGQADVSGRWGEATAAAEAARGLRDRKRQDILFKDTLSTQRVRFEAGERLQPFEPGAGGRDAERLYKERLTDVRLHYDDLIAEAERYGHDTTELEERKAAAIRRIERQRLVDHRQALDTDMAAEVAAALTTIGIWEDAETRLAFIRETAAQQDVANLELVLNARGGASQKMLAYLQDPANAAEELRAREIQGDDVVLQRKLANLETFIRARAGVGEQMEAFLRDERNQELLAAAARIAETQQVADRQIQALRVVNTAEVRAHEQRLELLKEEARAVGDWVQYFTLSMQQSVDAAAEFWGQIERLGQESARGLMGFWSDIFFDAWDGELDDAEEAWDNFLGSMRRALSDFLASQVVKAFMELGSSAAASLAALFGGLGSAGGASGASSAGMSSFFSGGGSILAGLGGLAAQYAGYATGNPMLSTGGGALSLLQGGYGLFTGAGGALPSLVTLEELGMNAGTVSMLSGGSMPTWAGLRSSLSTAGGMGAGLGVLGGGLSLAGALSGNRHLMTAGQLANVGSTGLGLYAAATGPGFAATAAGAGGGMMGAATAAAPYAAAALLAAMSIYNAFDVSGGNWKKLSEGQRTGTKIGAYASPINLLSGGLLSSVVPEEYSAFIDPISGFVGGLIGSFFGKPDIPHRVREAREFNRGLAATQGYIGGVNAAMTPNALLDAVIAATHPAYGGGAAATSPDTLGFGISLGGQQRSFLPGGGMSRDTLRTQLLTQPSVFQANAVLGVGQELKDQLSAALTGAVQARAAQFAELNSQINTALAEMLKAVVTPVTPKDFGAALKQRITEFRAISETLTSAAEQEIERQRFVLLGLTDPQQILEQTALVRRLLEERYNGEVELVREFVAQIEVAEDAWRSMRIAVEDQITALRLGQYGPTNPSEAVALTQMQFTEALALFRSQPTAENAERVTRLADPYLEAGSRQFARPSTDFRAIFRAVTEGLDDVADYARDREQELQRAIVEALGLNAQSIVGAVDASALIEQLQADRTAQLNQAIDTLRVDTADVFKAMGFDITGSLGVSAAKLAEIKSAQDAVAAAVANAPATTNSLLSTIAAYSATIAANTTPGPPGPPVPYENRDIYFAAASGLDYVPYDEFPTRLHRGEAVLRADQADRWRRGRSEGGPVYLNIGSVTVAQGGAAGAEEFMRRVESSVRTGRLGVVIAERVGRR